MFVPVVISSNRIMKWTSVQQKTREREEPVGYGCSPLQSGVASSKDFCAAPFFSFPQSQQLCKFQLQTCWCPMQKSDACTFKQCRLYSDLQYNYIFTLGGSQAGFIVVDRQVLPLELIVQAQLWRPNRVTETGRDDDKRQASVDLQRWSGIDTWFREDWSIRAWSKRIILQFRSSYQQH